MENKFGLEELEQLVRKVNVKSKDIKTVRLVLAITGVKDTISEEVRGAVDEAKGKLRGAISAKKTLKGYLEQNKAEIKLDKKDIKHVEKLLKKLN